MKRRPPRTSLIRRTTCRICGSPELADVLSLGDQYIAGAFAQPGGEQPVQRRIPVDLVRCDMERDENACGLIQLRHTVPGSVLYHSYWYRSGVNRTMTENLHGIARIAGNLAGLEPGDLVVDIGCNDGTLLDGYEERQLHFLGFDPSSVSRYAVEKGYDVVRDFFSADAFLRRYPDRRAKVVTSIAMFYDLEDPGAFVADIEPILAEDGVWVVELHYLAAMLEMNSFDAIVHEHLEYYSLAVIEHLVGGYGFHVARAELNDMNGGSIRLFIRRAGTPRDPQDLEGLHALRLREFELALDSAATYAEFARHAEQVRDNLRALCERLTSEGRTIHVYGASTKGNTILQYAGLDRSLIPHAADRNPDKWGSETIGSGIPIIAEEDSRAMQPDYYLVLPWHFLDEFLEREEKFLDRGGRFIVPLPDVRIVPDP